MIRRCDPQIQCNPYPEDFRDLSNFTYDSGLMLLRFRNAVKMRDGEDADYVLGAEFRASYDVDGVRHHIVVPRGMLTDLVSVHWSTRWLVSRVGPYLEAAILHDFLYIAWQDIPGRGARDGDRRFADRLMEVAMVEADVGLIRRKLIFWATRLLGGGVFAGRDPDRYVDLDDENVVAQFPGAVGNRHV